MIDERSEDFLDVFGRIKVVIDGAFYDVFGLDVVVFLDLFVGLLVILWGFLVCQLEVLIEEVREVIEVVVISETLGMFLDAGLDGFPGLFKVDREGGCIDCFEDGSGCYVVFKDVNQVG